MPPTNRYSDARPDLAVGTDVELLDRDLVWQGPNGPRYVPVLRDGKEHWLSARIREVIGPVVGDEPSYAREMDFEPNGYVVSTPWTTSGLTRIAKADEGRTWRRKRWLSAV